MRINTNISSLLAQRYLSRSEKAIGRALERLASGKRINSAGDDASGLARASSLESSIRSLTRGVLNVNDSFGVLQSIDASLASQVDLVQRMRELALQASNGVLSAKDRNLIGEEIQELISEFNRITEQAQFNGKKLLDGSLTNLQIHVGADEDEFIELDMSEIETTDVFQASIFEGELSFSESPLVLETLGDGPETADFDGDGISDLYNYNDSQDILEIHLNDGSGNFTSSSLSLEAGGSVSTVDFDGDGKTDISFEKDGRYEIYLSNGDGSFELADSFQSEVAADNNTYLDIDSDGDIDLVALDRLGMEFQVLKNNGEGQFESYSGVVDMSVFGGGGLFVVPVLNGNNDENVDLLAINLGKRSTLLVDDGAGNYTQTQVGGDGPPTYFDDLNGDGLTDFAFNNATSGSNIWLNNGDGTFATSSVSLSPGYFGGFADFNGDGLDDIFDYNPVADDVFYRINNGDGTFGALESLEFDTGLSQRTSEDVDGDGFEDIILSSATGQIHIAFADGQGGFNERITYNYDPSLSRTYFEDMDGDGDLDFLAESGTEKLQVIENITGRSFSDTPTFSIEKNSARVTDFVDLDGDGVKDILMVGSGNKDIHIYFQDTKENFETASISLQSQEQAQNLLNVFDNALNSLNERRAQIGAFSTRLDSVRAVSQVTKENLLSAKSVIEDTDYAYQTAELSKELILRQASVAVNLQANISMSLVLELLR